MEIGVRVGMGWKWGKGANGVDVGVMWEWVEVG